ncbi:MAG: hypothetical protein IJ622_05860 [Bacteroidales bacterium]|jgi:hypothetical protein|nr:hypothetical protein [Bacteroidales bacterium]
MEIDLKKEDLLLLGEDLLQHDDGCVCIAMTSLNATGMIWEREILIRNVLKLFGDQYKVVSMSRWPCDETEDECVLKITYFYTNLPWSMIEEYLDDDEFHF